MARWVGDEFPRVVREGFGRRADPVFLDESGFFLTPAARRALAPRGRTPVLDPWGRRDRLSAIRAITVSPVAARPNLFLDVYPHHAHGEQVVAFRADLHRRPGPLTVVRERGPIHDEAGVVRAWLADHPGVVTEEFPGHVPDLNPGEGVWGWTKYGRRANPTANDTDELLGWVMDQLVGVRSRPDLLRGFIRQTELPGVPLAA